MLQWAFHVMKELFYRVGLCTNVGKTVSMTCQICGALRGHYTEAYGLHMTGGGRTHQERLLIHVRCPEYDADLAMGSLAIHCQVQHR